LRIAFVTPELNSVVRRTTLAGVAEALAQALAAGKHDVRVFLPWTRMVDPDPLGEVVELPSLQVKDGSLRQTFRVYEGKLGLLTVYLFENEPFFSSRNPYGDDDGPYPDNWRRYSVFARAVLESPASLSWVPEIIHCMDWTTGLIPLYHKLEIADKQPDHPLAEAGTYFAIHNLAMQGVFEREVLAHAGIPHSCFKSVRGVELGGKVNFLKAGAEFATVLGTHSPSHAARIQERDRGYGLEEVFQRRRKELVGIHNGIDYQAWDPATDTALPANFKPSDRELVGKKKCKAALQTALKLDPGPRTPIAISIGRWDADSGFDLLAEGITDILERNVELILMGSGTPEMGQRMATLESSFIGRLRVIEGYNAHTAHLMMGGADALLLPSHYQPSNPLFAIAMRYGVVPLVYAKGGLEDVVVDARKDKRGGTGFQFEPYTAEGFIGGVNEVIQAYKDADKWRLLVRRALSQDFSWEAAAAEYVKAYRRVLRRTRTRASESA
jgi:starch synthase